MITTVKELWLKYPRAKFVFWVDDFCCWSRYFYSLDQLEPDMFNQEFEHDESQPWLKRCNEIWINLKINVI